MPRGNQRQEDNAHGLLRIASAVRQGHQAGGDDLTVAEVLVLSLIRDGVGYPVDKERGTRRNQRRNDRRGNGRDNDLAGNGRPLHASRAHRREGGADEAAEQGVGGTGRHTQQPGEQVPDNTADKASKDDHKQRLAVGVSGGAR